MKIIKQSAEKIKAAMEIDESLANAIRRSVLEIPILAIDDVEIFQNDSALYDEVIAHRLGLLPLEMDNSFTLPEKCGCKGKGCAKCTVEFKLQATGPAMVYSKDVKGKVKIVYENMPIVPLLKDQVLELTATAKLGLGIQHAKYTPGIIYYKNAEEIAEDKDISKENDSLGQGELLVSIESYGSISAKEMFLAAIEALNENLKDLEKEIK